MSTDVNAVGELAYWDDTNKRVTESSSGNKLIGVFVATAGNGVTTCTVRLNGALFHAIHKDLQQTLFPLKKAALPPLAINASSLDRKSVV